MGGANNHAEQTIVGRFERVVLAYEHHPALKDTHIEYTYGELNQKVNQLANRLKQEGLKQRDFVAIYLAPTADYVLCMLAILKVGGVYVPLDIDAPFNRLQDIITDARPRLLITSECHLDHLQGLDVNISVLKHLHLSSAANEKSNLEQSISADAPCYMMYTSGSTGKPKGVLVPHRAVLNLIDENALKIGPDENMAQFSNLAFDGSTFDIWTPLLHGATLVVLEQSVRGDYIQLREAIKAYQINALFLPTGYFHQLISAYPDTLDAVDKVMFGGERVNPHLIQSFVRYRQEKGLRFYLVNGYGPTEATGHVCRQIIHTDNYQPDEFFLSSIGQCIENVELYIVDEAMQWVDEGELCISGVSLAIGYHGEELNKTKFIDNPFSNNPLYQRLYKTGDKVKRLPTGELICLGRFDDQVKVGGYRIHLHEIEQQLLKHPSIEHAAVTVEVGGGTHKMLVAYLVFVSEEQVMDADAIRRFLLETLPAYMLPAKYVMVEQLPLTAIGKIDKRHLDALSHVDLSFHVDVSAKSDVEERIKGIWKNLLNRQHIDTHKNLFELGANSMMLTESCLRINQALQTELKISDVLANPSIIQLARFIEGDELTQSVHEHKKPQSNAIAIVGMSCRFPEADNLDLFWSNLCDGLDGLTRFEVKTKLHEVATRGVLNNIEQFDAAFFGISPADASMLDPQIRLFLECAYEALEQAGVVPHQLTGERVSVFSGMLDSSYLTEHILKNERQHASIDEIQKRIATNHSMLSTQISYRLNLKGKSVNVNTACSTGLITVEQACQDLLLGGSDVAIAGASAIVLPQDKPYSYQEGGIYSKDGYCRPFSDEANGTVFSNGVGVVVLKRLDDAIRDKDVIYAVIKGRGINNDGGDKLGFTAPSVHGQSNCIREALMDAQVAPDAIGLVEAHGTATALGDVIEIEALKKVYREHTDKVGYCALGSVKANIGHTDVTAGIAGLIKAALCLYHQKIPPLIHFTQANPDLSLDSSPFFVNTKLMDWGGHQPRYAAVSSFGVGGTNAHFILQSYTSSEVKSNSIRKEELILLSAKSEAALMQHREQFIDGLKAKDKSLSLSDIAYTLQSRRAHYAYRVFGVGKDRVEVEESLNHRSFSSVDIDKRHEIVFLFSGQGTQYPQMALSLMEALPRFASYVMKGAALAKSYLRQDLVELLKTADQQALARTEYAQPILFMIEYALARLLMDCGVKPAVMLGHSLGEYVAACLAGVFSFEDAISLVCERGLLMASAPKGAMLAIECDVETCLSYQEKVEVDIALHNSTHHCVVSGSVEAIDELERYLKKIRQPCQRLKVSHAFHSRLMAPLEASFKSLFSHIKLSAPQIPIVSNVTGEWLTPQQAMSADYWYQHLRQTVQLHRGINCILKDKHPLFVEIGPGQSMCHFVRGVSKNDVEAVSTLPSHQKRGSDLLQVLTALGQLWSKGVCVSFDSIFEENARRHVSLPTYPFQRERHWVESSQNLQKSIVPQEVKIYSPVLKRNLVPTFPLNYNALSSYQWVVLLNKASKIGRLWLQTIKKLKLNPVVLEIGSAYSMYDKHHYVIRVGVKEDYQRAMAAIQPILHRPVFVHTCSFDALAETYLSKNQIETELDQSFYSILYWTQAFTEVMPRSTALKMIVVTSGLQQVSGVDNIHPVNASLVGPCRVIPVEHQNIQMKLFDVGLKDSLKNQKNTIHYLLSRVSEFWDEIPLITSYRSHFYWTTHYHNDLVVKGSVQLSLIKDKGIYIVTGGLGGMALQLCEAIAKKVKAPVFVLISRRKIPSLSLWDKILKDKTDPFYSIVLQLRKVENIGGRFFFYSINLSSEADVCSVIHEIIKRFKSINGLIHAAGAAGGGVSYQKTKPLADEIFGSKIYGTYYLARALSKYKLDCVILMSSLAALVDTPGQVDYTAANACLNAFTESLFFNAEKVMSINWNTWRDAGMAVHAAQQGKASFIGLGNDISSQEGVNLFFDILSAHAPWVAISKTDLNLVKKTSLNLLEKCDFGKNIEQSLLTDNLIKEDDQIISQLKKIWQEALGIKHIDVNNDFFVLGGHSLIALQLVKKINARFSCDFLPTQLYASPTILAMSEVIQNRLAIEKHEQQIALPLKTMSSDAPNLFLCHPISGFIYCFNSFVEQSKLRCSLYGLQDPSTKSKGLIYLSLMEMAKAYLDAIKRVQATGPYYLMGYSFGGNLVHEIAYLLQQEGEEVKLLAMLDSWAMHSSENQDENYFKQQLATFNEVIPPFMLALAWEREKLLLNHSPTPLSQDMILFKADTLLGDYMGIDDPYNGWSRYNQGKIIRCILKGDHHSIMSKRNQKQVLQILSQYISPCLK